MVEFRRPEEADRMRAYCPHCKSSQALPRNAKRGLTVYCHSCRRPFILSDATVPGMKKQSLPFYNLLTLIVLVAIGYAAYVYYPKYVGEPRPVVDPASVKMQKTFDKVFVDCTVRNQGRGGLVRVYPSLVLTGDRLKPYPGQGYKSATLGRGESTEMHFEWPMSAGEVNQVVKVTFRTEGK